MVSFANIQIHISSPQLFLCSEQGQYAHKPWSRKKLSKNIPAHCSKDWETTK